MQKAAALYGSAAALRSASRRLGSTSVRADLDVGRWKFRFALGFSEKHCYAFLRLRRGRRPGHRLKKEMSWSSWKFIQPV